MSVVKKRGHISPEDNLRTILSVKKVDIFLGVCGVRFIV